ncbi:MAG: HD domain-containing protein [Lachnospiraceae bacterium]|nr:HD domain-containing protein [Lachnospiraceae bacterium]
MSVDNKETNNPDKDEGKLASITSGKTENKKSKRMQLLLPAVSCLIGILLNVGGKQLAASLSLPFYFDTPGMILCGILGGYIPAIVVAILTNILNYFSDPVSIYYLITSALIALVTTYLHKRGKLKKIGGFFLLLFLLALIGGGIGGAITHFIYGIGIDDKNGPFIHFLMGYGMSETASWYIYTFIVDLVDKAITLIFVSLVLYLIPKAVWPKFELVYWLQEPFKETSAQKKARRKLFSFKSLSSKIFMVLILFAGITSAICIVVSLVLFNNYTVDQHTYLAQGVAKMAAATVNGDEVDRYLSEGDDFDSYKETYRLLTNILKNTPDVSYVYVYKIMSDGCHVVFDPDTETVKGAKLGEVIPFDESFMAYLPDLLSGKKIDTVISNDKFGWLLTVYEPVYDSGGECVCYAAVDIAMADIGNYKVEFVFKILIVFSSFLILFFAFVIWLAKYHLIMPINAMAHTADEFDYSDEYARKTNVKKLSSLDIRTGEEIERLYKAFLTTTEESTRYFEANKKQHEKIEEMQSSLVMVLADLVENRDELTGDHVRKTAAYVDIICHKMRELGYYKDQLTDKFITDAVRSAPLHDIGKISIPDMILKKPGKLTDEEFEIMKTHSTEGMKDIEKAIETLPDADYLEEARNMAGYHHEKWNGKGYPKGLSGEEIPLSARIMAVADVFDALVSKRCYKEAFSYDKAMNIIKEDAGTHFDPLVADAFIKARDQIEEVANRFAGET